MRLKPSRVDFASLGYGGRMTGSALWLELFAVLRFCVERILGTMVCELASISGG